LFRNSAAGVQPVFTSSGLSNYRPADWLGSSRFATTTAGAVQYDRSYAPFGETYNGATGSAGLGLVARVSRLKSMGCPGFALLVG
jgi:hypothetical protein